MNTQTSQKAELFGRTLRLCILGVFAVFAWAIFITCISPHKTDAVTSSTINFQARLENSSGSIANDGTYNVEFKLYNSSSSSGSSQGSCTGDSSCLWYEDYLVSASTGVQVVNGYLTVNLGGSPYQFPTNMNWNQQLWLTMRIGGTGSSPSWDTEMSPRLLLTATPYSFQAGQLSATNSGYVGTLSFASTLTGTDTITIPDTGGTVGTVCLQSSSGCGFLMGSGNGVQLQSGTPGTPQVGNYNINGTGIAGILQGSTSVLTPLLDTPTAVALNIGTSNATNINLNQNTTILSNKSLTANGSVTFEDATNSTTAFQVQNSTGTAILGVNTSTPAVQVTGALTDSTEIVNDIALVQNAGAGTNALTVDNNLGIPLVTTGSDNLLVNGDFEGSTSTTGWTAVGTGASITQNTLPTYVYSGSGSLAITVSTTANVGAKVTSFNNVLPTGTYVLSFWAKAATAFSTLEASFSATPGTNNCTLNSNSVSTSAFTNYYCTYTTSGTTSAISIGSSGTTALTFYVDAVQLINASTTNLISNSGFETGTTNWSATGTGATIAQNSSKSTVYDGQSDLTVTTGTTANSGATDSTYISTLGAATYTLSFWAEGTTAFTTLQASLNGGTNNCTLNSNTLSTTGFQEYYCTYAAGGAPTIEIGSSGTTAVTFYLDDVQLVIGSSLQPYNIGQTQLGGIITNPVIFQGNSNSTMAFQIQNAAGTALLSADTSNMQIIIGNTTNGVAISTSSGITTYGTAQHTIKLVLTAEYAGAVLDNGGASSDVGTMTAGYDSTQKENYYQWTTAQSTNQTYDIVVQIPIPSNFSAWASSDPLTVDVNLSSTSNGAVVGTLLDTSGAAVTNWNTCTLTPTATGWVTSGAGGTNAPTACAITTGTWTAGGVATLRLHLQAPPSGTTGVGDIVLTYKSNF